MAFAQKRLTQTMAMALALVALVIGLSTGITPAYADKLMATQAVTTASTESEPLYRMYNPNSGEHLYTASVKERDLLMPIGWLYEGTSWESPKTSKTPVYRLYNPNSGDHHYTTSASERDQLKVIGWNDEGISWYSDDSHRVAVYRVFNPNETVGTHHYTTSSSEYDQLGTIGWNKEGVGWYAVKKGVGLPKSLTYSEYLKTTLNIQDARYAEFEHGYKGADHQKYIMLHDTEIDGSARSIADFWLKQKQGIATHFVVGKDGTVVQCVSMDQVAWHAGYGDSISLKAATNGDMNSYSIGIEMVHVGGTGGYPEAQLAALDRLIAYIDAYYGFQSTIVDHKMWRSTNSDTSPEFAKYLANYRLIRKHA